jgi:uncharacterized membrane protein
MPLNRIGKLQAFSFDMHDRQLSFSIKMYAVKQREKHPWLPVSLALVVLLVTQLPYLLAALNAGYQYRFTGFLLNPLDGLSYLAKMQQGWLGSWRFRLPFSSDPGEGAYLFLFYLFLGHLARWLDLSLLSVYHLARLIGSVFMLWALYRFFNRVFPEARLSQTAYALAVLGSGIGWIAVPFGAVTSDFWVAEAYPFLSAFSAPHFSIGLGLLLELLAPLVEHADQSQSALWRYARLLLLAGLLGILSPFGVVIVVLVYTGLAAWQAADAWKQGTLKVQTLWRTSALNDLVVIVLSGVPWLLYDYWAATQDPVLSGWNAQNLTPSPPVWDLFLALSPVLLLALISLRHSLRANNRGLRLLLAWSALGLALLYLPFGLQRRFLMGLFVPFCGVAAVGIGLWSQRSRRGPAFLTGMTLLVSLPTLAIIFLGIRQAIRSHDPHLYLTRGESLALQWLEGHSPAGALILSGPQTGAFIPAFTGRRVIYGHPFETVHADQEKANLAHFFQEAPDAWTAQQAGQFLARRQVDYVWVGPRERQLGGLPPGLSLTQVYSQDGVLLYNTRQAP